MKDLVNLLKKNIYTALEDYGRHTDLTEVLDCVSDDFVERLAQDSAYAKQDLRELFRKSPVWDEDLQAIVINGTRTHNSDEDTVSLFATLILEDSHTLNIDTKRDLVNFFTALACDNCVIPHSLELLNTIAPNAFKPGKKPSRVFKALCAALGIVDETPGSEFQKRYARLADEMSAKQIDFKLYVSINPAHFLTMSNPKRDTRGNTLTSCHSFNCTDYDYNNGCSGYARDNTSFIVFTVSDPSDPETLNNRKTTRQVFAYEPGNGLLLQSRLYNTSGGTRGAQEESKMYRDLVQREISALEEAPNLWKTIPYVEHPGYITEGEGFGGYPDWIYSEFDAKVSLRNDHKDDFHPITVGTYGLCINCASLTSNGVSCCGFNASRCDCCGDRCDEITRAYDQHGDECYVCEDCLEQYYIYCEECGEYNHMDAVTYVNSVGHYVCNDCLENGFTQCDDCDEYFPDDMVFPAIDRFGNEVCVCQDCLDDHYLECEDCGKVFHRDSCKEVFDEDGDNKWVCNDCMKKYDEEVA